jgi:hypothetical protein
VCLLRHGDLDRLESLLETHDEPSALWRYLSALCAFRREGDGPTAQKRAKAAYKCNRHVRKYLLGTTPMPDSVPDMFEPGKDSEAVIAADELGVYWEATPGAVEWLRKATRPTTSAGKTRRRRRRKR